MAALNVPPADVAGVQAKLAEAVPNASAFDLSAVLNIVTDVLAQIVAVVQFLASLVIAVGLVLLGGMVVSTRAARVRETAILRTVGAKAAQVRRMLIIEYGVLGLSAGLLAAILAEGAAWGVTTKALSLPWSPFLWQVALGLVIFTALAIGVGVLAALPILRVAPLRTLREE
jgi:putative ABC transport system permease protein